MAWLQPIELCAVGESNTIGESSIVAANHNGTPRPLPLGTHLQRPISYAQARSKF
jgi:hypothetical protein